MSARKKKNEREKKRRERKGRRKIEEKNSIFRETFARHWDALRRTKLGYSRAWKFDWPAAALMISCARERESFASHQRTGFLAFDDGPVDVTGCKQRSRPDLSHSISFYISFSRQRREWILFSFLLPISIRDLIFFFLTKILRDYPYLYGTC